MRTTFLNRATGTVAAALMLVGLSQPASAQSLRAQIDAEMRYISSGNPGSALVFAGCAATAANEYNITGSTQRGVNVLVGCAAIGCGLTDSYSNCLSVNTRLFLLMLSRP
ncbi:MAG: hypothetical protein B7Y36_00455 [Novosphingobium sp. 28-62-57]|uniref:hypothetical protein n=1 Tax=unclassified Novosphingobium TaxID=2644732 RepID=UPI000BCFA832|nr:MULTISPECIES: hypothetical protein [unclassified Novosphingobium]OYW48779.1 MAG: hypothetical protein B7Z34_11950 [Novosphingobium sp. 12-62-10]OYZ12065.1 MAG: hypothetical protein B7Y36_00455 [Novosphingobium sp. 28-62-57]OZA31891.1 MAG: hypothetical protein B7X92_13250 [Novosphingobium sp. 17-62-9]HQS70075.1 hypothetical protein [Novosphingobium sp.]